MKKTRRRFMNFSKMLIHVTPIEDLPSLIDVYTEGGIKVEVYASRPAYGYKKVLFGDK